MVPCLRHSSICRRHVYVPLRSALNAWSPLPLRSVLNARHRHAAPRAHTVLSANVRASGQASLPVCASACRAFIVNFHAALGAAPPRMKARIAPCLRQSTLPLRSVLNKRSTFHFGRCWTRGLHSVPVVAGQAPLALSNTGTQQHWRLAPRTHTTLPSDVCESLRASTPCLTAAVRGFHSKC